GGAGGRGGVLEARGKGGGGWAGGWGGGCRGAGGAGVLSPTPPYLAFNSASCSLMTSALKWVYQARSLARESSSNRSRLLLIQRATSARSSRVRHPRKRRMTSWTLAACMSPASFWTTLLPRLRGRPSPSAMQATLK